MKILQIERQLLREKQTVETCSLSADEGRLTANSNGMDSPSPQRHQSARLGMLINQSTARRSPLMNISRVGIDLAKNVFQVHGVDRLGQVVVRG